MSLCYNVRMVREPLRLVSSPTCMNRDVDLITWLNDPTTSVHEAETMAQAADGDLCNSEPVSHRLSLLPTEQRRRRQPA